VFFAIASPGLYGSLRETPARRAAKPLVIV
jgi:hypothetical protein